MARARPRSRVLSKNTVSPSPTATNTEIASNTNAFPDIAVSAASPPVASTHTRIRPPPTVDRTAFSVTELNAGASERTSRPVTAQLSAEPVAHRPPSAGSERSIAGDSVTARAAACDAGRSGPAQTNSRSRCLAISPTNRVRTRTAPTRSPRSTASLGEQEYSTSACPNPDTPWSVARSRSVALSASFIAGQPPCCGHRSPRADPDGHYAGRRRVSSRRRKLTPHRSDPSRRVDGGPARLPRVGGARTPSALSPAIVMVRRAVRRTVPSTHAFPPRNGHPRAALASPGPLDYAVAEFPRGAHHGAVMD